MSSNDYYGALNRRFDCRMRKLFSICRKGSSDFPQLRFNSEARTFSRWNRDVLNTSQIMHMSNRCFRDKIAGMSLV